LRRKFKFYLRRSRQREWFDYPSIQGDRVWVGLQNLPNLHLALWRYAGGGTRPFPVAQRRDSCVECSPSQFLPLGSGLRIAPRSISPSGWLFSQLGLWTLLVREGFLHLWQGGARAMDATAKTGNRRPIPLQPQSDAWVDRAGAARVGRLVQLTSPVPLHACCRRGFSHSRGGRRGTVVGSHA
jgi:hypothetical protein